MPHKELTPLDAAEILYETVVDQPNINRQTLIPAFTGVIKAFVKANSPVLIEKRKDEKMNHILAVESDLNYWKRVVKKLYPDNMEVHYAAIEELRKQII